MKKFCLLSALAVTALLCVPAAMGAGRIVVKADELASSPSDRLVMLPDGSVFHLARLHLRALFNVQESGDALIYDVANDTMVVRRNVLPSELLLVEPLQPVLIEPSPFVGINVQNEVALFDNAASFFFSSFPGYPYQADALDGNNRLIYVGRIAVSYAGLQPSMNPFQPDGDTDGVPNASDNCSVVANGPLLPDAGGNVQRDTDDDGLGNRCDADLNNDCIVDAVDLGLIKPAFFGTGPDEDFNGDGIVNAIDLGIMKAGFFQPPGPSGVPNACGR